MKETLKIAYLFLISHEPVLVFSINHDARNFRDKMSGGRISGDTPTWVYMPMPRGLLMVRRSKYGDVAFDFRDVESAQEWNMEIAGVGTNYAKDPERKRSVYLGKRLVKEEPKGEMVAVSSNPSDY
jgi:hypothetical protein